MGEKKKEEGEIAMQCTKQWWEACTLIEGSAVGSLLEGHQRAQIQSPDFSNRGR